MLGFMLHPKNTKQNWSGIFSPIKIERMFKNNYYVSDGKMELFIHFWEIENWGNQLIKRTRGNIVQKP